jgi:hypothetical protein
MPVEKVRVQAIWGPRRESVDEVARRWATSNRELASIDPTLSRWVAVYRDEGGYREEELDTEAALAGIVEIGARAARPGLSFGFSAWNGRHGEQDTFFHGQAGLAEATAGLVNAVRVETRPDSPEALRRWTTAAPAVLMALVRAWAPDYAMVWTDAVRRPQNVRPAHPFAGYVTYLSAPRARLVPELPEAAATEDGGLLLSVLTPAEAWPEPDAAVRLGLRLSEAGVLYPATGS